MPQQNIFQKSVIGIHNKAVTGMPLSHLNKGITNVVIGSFAFMKL